MTVYIKNMVCEQSISSVQSLLDELGIVFERVDFGRADLPHQLTREQSEELKDRLHKINMELVENKRLIIVERIKSVIIDMIYNDESSPVLKLSVTVGQALDYDYTYLSNIFSEVEGSTIERFYITTRVNRVQELLANEHKSIKEISQLLHYSSVPHLCSQFKKVTGQRPSDFKKSTQNCVETMSSQHYEN